MIMESGESPRDHNTGWFIILACIVVFWSIRGWTAVSYAGDFTASTIEDHGDVVVMEVAGCYDADHGGPCDSYFARQTVAKAFFTTHPDAYDFLVIFTNFPFKMISEDAIAFYIPVRNGARGLGIDLFDHSFLYGSNGKLQGAVDMGNVADLSSDPLDAGFEKTMTTLAHELLHQWAAHVTFIDEEGQVSDDLLGKKSPGEDKGSHWSYLLNTSGSVLYGNRWLDNGDGTFSSHQARKYYSPLDLYLAGLYHPSEVPPMLLIDNPDIDPEKLPESGVAITGAPRTVTIDDIIAAEGERIPGPDESQKDFRIGFVLAVRPGGPIGSEVARIRTIIRNWVIWHSSLTLGKSRILVDDAPPLDIPVNPGPPPGGAPRDTPPQIEDGVLWLMNNQASDGSWTDPGGSPGWSAAEATLALRHFEEAAGHHALGVQWLRGEAFRDTDSLSRGIEALSLSGEDVSGWVDELLAMRNADGAWGYNRRYTSNPVDASLALKALGAAGHSDPGAIDPLIAWLEIRKIETGRWGGHDRKSSLPVSIHTVTGLLYYKESHPCDDAIQAFLAWVEELRNPDGGFGPGGGSAHDTAMALTIAREVDLFSDVYGDALLHLLNAQAGDGSWHESAHTTALAVNALHAWRDALSADLSIHGADMICIPKTVTRTPETITVRAVVRNPGLGAAVGARAALYDGEVAEENKVGERMIDVEGESHVAVAFSVAISDTENHRFTIVLDPDDEVEEFSEFNNIAVKHLPNELNPAPDPRVDVADVSLNPAAIIRIPDVVTVSVPVRNDGLTAAVGLKIALYDGAVFSANKLDERIVDAPPGATTPVSLSAPVNDATVHRLFIVVDPGNEIEERDESNNTVMTFLHPATTYDLEVSALSASLPAVGQDEPVVLSARIRNSGTSDAYKAVIRFTIETGAGAAIIAAPQVDVPAGTAVDYAFSWTASIIGTDLTLSVQADPANAFDELSETNNTASTLLTVTPHAEPNLSLAPADLSVSPSPAHEAGDAAITAMVHNTGVVDLASVRVDFFQREAGGENQLIGSREIAHLPAGGSAPAVMVWAGIPLRGDRIITAIADPGSRIPEYNEEDNGAFTTLTILDLPDLAVSPGAISFTPETPGPEEAVLVEAVVQNLGGQDAVDVRIAAREEGALLFETTLPLLEAHSETTLSFTRDAAGKSGFHVITVHVDPLETILERSRDNNTAERGFGVQDASLWISERYFSPDGDGIRDETVFFFRLDAARDVVVVVLNDNDEVVRTWTGPSFENTSGGAVSWDGLVEAGTVAPDGEYRFQVVDASGLALKGLPVAVDNNRSPLALAFGTDHLLEISCAMACFAHEGLWLPDDGGVLYESGGLFIGPPLGDAPTRLGPEEWDDGTRWDYSRWTLSGDGERIAFFYNPDDGVDRNRLWVMDRYGASPTLVDALASTFYTRPRLLSWSADGATLAYVDYVGGYRGYHPTLVKTDGSGKRLLAELNRSIYALTWSPDGPELAYYVNADPTSSIHVVDDRGNEIDAFYVDASYITDMRWLADGKLLLYQDGPGEHRFWLTDVRGGGEPILLPLPCTDWDFEFEISPDGRHIAFFCDENAGPVITLVDPAGNATLLHEGDAADVIWLDLKNWDPKITWSHDSRKIAFIDYQRINSCQQHEAFLTTIDIDAPARTSHPIPGTKGCYTHACNYTSNTSCYAYPPDSTADDTRENQWAARYVSFFQDNRHVLIPRDFRYIVMDSFTGDLIASRPWSCANDNPPTHSPSGAHATLAEGGSCAVVKSLLNLTADLQVLRKDDHVLFKGSAADQHFDRYTLEWADASDPDRWRPIQPPSGSQVVNGDLGVWIPPRPGSFYARLTVYDLAGGVAMTRKPVLWSRSLALVDLYKVGRLFSPNGDGEKDAVEVHFTVLEPIDLRFFIHDAGGRLVRTIARSYPAPGPGGREDHIAWDGADENGATVPDGIYRLTVLDYEFVFEVDDTPPEAGVEIGRIICKKNAVEAKDVYSDLTALAADRNITGWIVEYGEGNNPSEWNELARGDGSLHSLDDAGARTPHLIERFAAEKGRLVFPAGKRFRITAWDDAGNRTAVLSEIIEELLLFTHLGNIEKGERSFIPFGRTDEGGFDSGRTVPVERSVEKRTILTLTVQETVRAPLTEIHVRYWRNGAPHDSPTIPYPGDGLVKIVWSELGCRFQRKLVIRAVDANGASHESNIADVDCIGSLPSQGLGLEVDYAAPDECDSLSDGIARIRTGADPPFRRPISADYYFSADAPDWSGESTHLRSVDLTKEGFPRIRLDTSVLDEGRYWIMLDLDYLDSDDEVINQKTAAEFWVDRRLPLARIDSPGGANPVCILTDGHSGRGLPIYGEASSAGGSPIIEYSFKYGPGEAPGSWSTAMTWIRCATTPPCPLKGEVERSGYLGFWNFRGLGSSVMGLRLKSFDMARNLSCHDVVVQTKKTLRGYGMVDKEMISPNGDGILDEVAIELHIDEEVLLDLEVREIEDTPLDGLVVKTILRQAPHAAGVGVAAWDGRDDDGQVVPDDAYRILLHVTDACGNAIMRLVGEVEVDNTPPSLAITRPAPGDLLGVMVTARGVVLDEHLDRWRLEVLDEASTPIRILAEAESVRDDQPLAVWNTFGLDGIRVLRLWASDELGNSAETTAVVDLDHRPTYIRGLRVAPDYISPNDDGFSDVAIIEVALDGAGSAPLDLSAEIALEGTVHKTITLFSAHPGDHAFQWNGSNDAGSPAPDGEYAVTVTAAPPSRPDLACTETAPVILDATPPRFQLLVSEGATHVPTDPMVTGSIFDENLAEYTVTWAGNGMAGVVEQGKRARRDHVFGAVAGLDDGAYVVTAMARDLAGNIAETRLHFILDRTPPAPALLSPEPGMIVGGAGAAAEIRGLVDEANPSTWTLRFGSGDEPAQWTELTGGRGAPADPFTFSWAAGVGKGVPDGDYTLSLHAADKAGWEAEARTSITVDNTPPALAVTAPADAQWVTGAMTVEGSVMDPHLREYTVALSEGRCADAFQWAPIKTSSDPVETGALAQLGSLPGDGDYCIRLSASDGVGNAAETGVDVTVDATPPAPPALSGAAVDQTDVTLAWTGNGEPDLAGFYVFRDGVRLNAEPLSSPDFIDRPGEGAYTWRVTAADLAGNESAPSNPAALTVDSTPPLARIQAPTRGALARDLVTIKGTAFSEDDFRQYRVYTGRGAAPSAWSLIHASPLPTRAAPLAAWDAMAAGDGAHAIRLEAEDLAGNIAVHEIAVVVDNTPPAAPVLLTAEQPDPHAPNARLEWRTGAEPDLAGCLLYRNNGLANHPGAVIGDLTPWLLQADLYEDANLPDGAFSYFVTAMDRAGNMSAASNLLGVDIDVRAPHLAITAPPDQHAFDAPLLIRAESADLDIARVRFQWRSDPGEPWSDLAAPILTPPYAAYLDPGTLGLAPGVVSIRALATDHGDRTDPAPPEITVNHTDVTPPAPPRDLAARMDGARVLLTWSPGGEPDLNGCHVYRLDGETPLRITPVVATEPLFEDPGRPDGEHLYEITAVDASGNESAPSNRAAVLVYTPALQPPVSPTPFSEILVRGWNARAGDPVEIFVDAGSGPVSAGVAAADASGEFSRLIALTPGPNAITAVASDGVDGRSAAARVEALYDPPPAAPTGLAASAADQTVSLSWNANAESDLAGYCLHRDGERVNALKAVRTGTASASGYSSPGLPSRAVDGDPATYWYHDDYYTSIPDEAWWEVDLDAPEAIHRIDIDFRESNTSARDYEILAWSGAEWAVLKKVTGNEAPLNTFDLPFPRSLDRVRVHITATNWTLDTLFKINEFTMLQIDPVTGETHEDADLANAVYAYRISAVDRNGFESPLSDEIVVEVGDATPPEAPRDLTAAVSGADVTLAWSPCPGPDLAGYIVYKRSDQGWERQNAQLLAETGYSDPGLLNGTHAYRVAAEDAVGNESPPSDAVEAVVDLGRLAPPADLIVAAPPEGEILIACWTHEGGAAGYILRAAETAGGPYVPVVPTPLTETCFTDAGLTNGVARFYVVAAVDAAGNESEPSGEASGTPRETVPPPAPDLFQPTIPGWPVDVDVPRADIRGWAEADAEVELFVNGRSVGIVNASDRDISGFPIYSSSDNNAFSPDGRFFAYINGSYGNIRIRDLDGGGYERLNVIGRALSWYSDGGKILFVKKEYSPFDHRIAVYDRVDETETLLTDDLGAIESSPTPSPDGEKVAFISDRDGLPAIWVLDWSDGSLVKIADGDVHGPVFSPDGALLAHAEPGSRVLYITDLTDGSVIRVDEALFIPDSGDPRCAWAPGANHLAFVSTRDGAPDMYIREAETGDVRRVTDTDASEISMAWSPDGGRLVYSVVEGAHARLRVLSTRNPTLERRLYYYWYDGNFGPVSWLPSGEIISRDGYRFVATLPEGHFIAEGVELDMGDNHVTAEASDASGNRSPASDAISLFFDPDLLPDLDITENDIYIHPSAPVAGDRITGVVFFRNRNLTPAENMTLAIHILDPAGHATPAASEIFERVESGAEEFASFSADSSGMAGEIRIMVSLDAADAVRESDETNNLALKTVRIASEQGVTMTTTLDFERYESGEEMVVDVALSNDGPPGAITLEAWIETDEGARVASVDAVGFRLPHGTISHRFTWRVGMMGAGAHQVRVTAAAESGPLAENTAPFHIDALIQLESALSLDNTIKGPDEELTISVNLKNSGSEPLVPALAVLLRVVRADGTVLFSETRPLANLLRGAPVRLAVRWNTGRNAPGLHHAEARVYIDGQPVSDAARDFEILPRIRLTGALTLSPTLPQPGETVYADFTIENGGNTDAGGLDLTAVLVDPDASTDVAVRETGVSVGMDESVSGRFDFSTSGLGLKTYWILLRAAGDHLAEGGSLAVASFTLKDRTPPVLTITSPADAAAHGPGAALALSITAVDDASGVARVEHRVDEGKWKPLPAADPSIGLYFTRLSVAGLDQGAHRISARGVDGAGNVSIPVSTFITVEFYPAVSATKTDELFVDRNNDGRASPGDSLRYRVEILNQGVANAESVVFHDAFDDPHLSLEAGTVTASQGVVPGGNNAGDAEVRVEIGAIPPDSPAVVIAFEAVIDGSAPPDVSSVVNQGRITRAAPGDALTNDPDTPAPDDPTRTPVAAGALAAADLSLAMTDDPDPVIPGQRLTYAVAVANDGPAEARNVLLQANIAAGLRGMEYSLDDGATWKPWSGRLKMDDLPAGNAASVLLRGTAAENVADALTASVAVTSDLPDPNPADNQAAETTEIDGGALAAADLSLAMTDDPDPVIPGQRLTYAIAVGNDGPAEARNVLLQANIPAGLRDAEYSLDDGASWNPWSGRLKMGVLPAGDAASVLLRGTAAENIADALTASVAVTSDLPDPNPADNQAAETTEIVGDAPGEADLSLTMTDDPDPVRAGQSLTYTITIANAGPSAARGVRLSDDPPADLSTPAYTIDNGSTWSPWPGVLNLGDLPAGDARVVYISGTAAESVTGPLTNTAAVSSDVPDPNPSDNEAVQAAGVLYNPPFGWMTVNVAEWPDMEWRMVWINNAAARPLEVLVGNSIPDGLFFTRGSLACEARGSTVATLCGYDASIDAIAWRGVMGPDFGAQREREAQNEVVITFRARVFPGISEVRNQGMAFWDENGDGRTDAADPNLRDNAPAVTIPGDGTLARQGEVVLVPGLKPWGMVFLMMLLAILGAVRILGWKGGRWMDG